jgi:hypothetical protein
MKTAMQELIDKLSNSIKFEYRNELVNALEKEKMQIIDAANQNVFVGNKVLTKGENYYNQTYEKK